MAVAEQYIKKAQKMFHIVAVWELVAELEYFKADYDSARKCYETLLALADGINFVSQCFMLC